MGLLLKRLAAKHQMTQEEQEDAVGSDPTPWIKGKQLPQKRYLEKLPLAYRTTPREFYLGLGVCIIDCVLGTEEANKRNRLDPYQDALTILDKTRALWQLYAEDLDAPAEVRERMAAVRNAFIPAAENFKILLLAFDELLRHYPRVPFESLATEAEAPPDDGDPDGR